MPSQFAESGQMLKMSLRGSSLEVSAKSRTAMDELDEFVDVPKEAGSMIGISLHEDAGGVSK